MRKRVAIVVAAAALLLAGAARAETAPAPCGAGVPDQIFSAYVRTAQRELNLHGYDAGVPDGRLTPKTEAAVRAYQRDARLTADGCVTKNLLDHLQFVLPRVEKARSGRAQPEVIEAQTLLTRRGYYLGAVDGIEGARTRAAVRRFQADANLPVTGRLDPALIDAIKSADPRIRGDKESGAAHR